MEHADFDFDGAKSPAYSADDVKRERHKAYLRRKMLEDAEFAERIKQAQKKKAKVYNENLRRKNNREAQENELAKLLEKLPSGLIDADEMTRLFIECCDTTVRFEGQVMTMWDTFKRRKNVNVATGFLWHLLSTHYPDLIDLDAFCEATGAAHDLVRLWAKEVRTRLQEACDGAEADLTSPPSGATKEQQQTLKDTPAEVPQKASKEFELFLEEASGDGCSGLTRLTLRNGAKQETIHIDRSKAEMIMQVVSVMLKAH